MDSVGEPLDFFTADPPTKTEIDQVLKQLIKQLTLYLEKQKIVVKNSNQDFQLEITEEGRFVDIKNYLANRERKRT